MRFIRSLKPLILKDSTFGSMIKDRAFQDFKNFRYKFNGKESDDEVYGEGNSQDYGMRIYNNRLGRFLSLDFIADEYPELTPYQFASDRPIQGVDLDGLEFFLLGASNYMTLGEIGIEAGAKIEIVNAPPPITIPVPPVTLPIPQTGTVPNTATKSTPKTVPAQGQLKNGGKVAQTAIDKAKLQRSKLGKTKAEDIDYNEEAENAKLAKLEKALEGKGKTGTSTKENTKGQGGNEDEIEKAKNQSEDINKAKDKAGKEAPKGTKQNKINSTKKSDQNLKNALKKAAQKDGN